MKNFLKKILFFFSLPILFFIVFISYANIASKSYELKKDVTDLYIGDSHIKEAINDSLMSNSKNIGMVAESYYFSYYKLKFLIENTPKIEKIYLGVGYHNLSNLFDLFTNGKRSYFYAPPYFYILPFKEKMRVLYWNLNCLNLFIKNIITEGFKSIIDKPSFIGYGFQNSLSLESSKTYVDLRIKDQFYNEDKLKVFSTLNIIYLEKIINMLKRKKIELIILNLPTDSYYFSKIPQSYLIKYNEVIKKHHLNIIDFKELDLNNGSYFMPDGDHVNKNGAFKVTQELNRFKLSN